MVLLCPNAASSFANDFELHFETKNIVLPVMKYEQIIQDNLVLINVCLPSKGLLHVKNKTQINPMCTQIYLGSIVNLVLIVRGKV